MANETAPRERAYYVCCGPQGRLGISFCGISLVVIGTLWLLSNLGVFSYDWWDFLLPVLLIGWGLVHLISSRKLGR